MTEDAGALWDFVGALLVVRTGEGVGGGWAVFCDAKCLLKHPTSWRQHIFIHDSPSLPRRSRRQGGRGLPLNTYWGCTQQTSVSYPLSPGGAAASKRQGGRQHKEPVNPSLTPPPHPCHPRAAAAYRAKVDGTASGRSPFDRAASIRSASALGSKTLAHDDFKSFRSTPDRAQRSQLGLGRWASNNGGGRGDSNPRE